MKNRLFAFTLVLAMLFAMLAGCGSEAASEAAVDVSESVVSTETSAPDETVQQEPEAPEETPEEASVEEVPAEPVELQPVMTEETAALLAATAEAAGVATAVEYGDISNNPTWSFVTSEEYQTAINEVRAGIDANMPTSEHSYDQEGNLLSCKGVPYAYPLDDGHSITVFAVNRGLTSNYVSCLSELITFQLAATETNVDAAFTTVPGDAAETQMNLIFASGDYPDLVSYFSGAYSGTAATAYENDLIVPLNDYLEDYSPNYKAWLDSNEVYSKSVTADDGNVYAWYALATATSMEQGSWVRKDLVEKFGIEVPSTVAEMEEYFALCKDEGLSSVISCSAYGFPILSGAFDIPDLGAGSGFGVGLYHEGDEVKSILTADNSEKFQEYIAKLNEWYELGYYADDLVSFTSTDNTQINNLIYNGETGYMYSGSGHYANYLQQAAVENWDIEPTPTIVMNEGDVNHYLANSMIRSNPGSIVLTTACEDIEAACRYIDWFYSDMGINTTNYGPEGVSWNWSEDGTTREFTSAIYADQVFGLGAAPAMMMYTGSTTFASICDPLYNLYFGSSMVPVTCQKLWAEACDSEKYLDTSVLSLTPEESEEASRILSDLTTYLEESLIKFLIGDLDVEADWEEFSDTVVSMGINDVVDIYQTAYDRYLER